MTDRSNNNINAVVKPIWMKQAEEAKLKKGELEEDLANKPVGPVDPAKCTAVGAGIADGTAFAPSMFIVVTKDADGREVPHGAAQIKVKVSPGVGVGGYSARRNCEGYGGWDLHSTSTGGLLGMAPASTFPNLSLPDHAQHAKLFGICFWAFPGLIGMIPGIVPGASGGAILPGIGASLGEVCREYLNGRCAKSDYKLNHPPHNLLMTALAATTTMGTLSKVPMAPSAAAMAAAQAIVAAQALQAHAARVQAQNQSAKDSTGSLDEAGKEDTLNKMLQVSNLSPLLTVDQLKQLFGYFGTVVYCTITDSRHLAYIEYSEPEEATAALALNNMDVGGWPLNVEMAK
ncbi:hypothetical protein GH714_022753 [Hevea brasiliensis]|uniref:RRM domain-containing protein n=1 Tax=Hevea brasiliensis TaxID=3981 RepID=A0A6A6KJ20_HEVBR|nr:hypothetical protein GH714_022753 [Hevea brasiliensis]